MSVRYDPYSYEIDVDPYPTYRRLRDEAPVYYDEEHDFYALSRYDDCLMALTDWRRFSSARGTVLELMDRVETTGPLIIFMDPPRQTRMRNLVSKTFTPKRIHALEPQIREIAQGWLDPLVERGECDVVKEFTAKLPMDVISTLLGIPASDRDMVREWSNAMLHRDAGNPLPTAEGLRSMSQLMDYFQEALTERRARPRDDLMTELTVAEVADENGEKHRLDDLSIKAFFNLLSTAGNETVTKLLATSYYWLARYPETRRRIAEDPAVTPGAVDELLRFDPPSQYQGRVTTCDVTLHGVTIPEGGKVAIINAAGGRDDRKYADPDVLDIDRDVDVQINFGYGRHVCLGKHLALLESRIAIDELLARIPEYEAPDEGVERMHSSNVRGMSGLKLYWKS